MRAPAAALLLLVGCGSSTPAPGQVAEICGVDEAAEPSLDLWHYGEPVTDGTVLRVDCGPQGLFMISLLPELAGFAPAAAWLDVELAMDVPGFNLGPGGLFYEMADLPHYVGCEDDDGTSAPLSFIVPDEVWDVEQLDGATGRLRVVVDTPGDPLVRELAFTISAQNVGDYFFCYG